MYIYIPYRTYEGQEKKFMEPVSGLLTGIPGMDRVRPRRAAGRASTGTAGRRVRRVHVDVFFQKCTLHVSYLCPSRVHGYRYAGIFFSVLLFFLFFFLFFLFLFFVFVFFSTGTGIDLM
jgi:hypothetical protein